MDRPNWWHFYTLSATWGSFLIFGGGSVFNKNFPLLQIALKKGASPLIRQQAVVILIGIGLGLSGFIILIWAPTAIHFPPPANTQWGALPLPSTLFPSATPSCATNSSTSGWWCARVWSTRC